MKHLISCILVLSSISAFADEYTAPEALRTIIQPGFYNGETPTGEKCSVAVNEVNYPAKDLSVTVQNNTSKLFKLVKDGSSYLYRSWKSEFSQSERLYVDESRIYYVDRVVRTVATDDNRLYVVVANETTINRDFKQEVIECIVNKY